MPISAPEAADSRIGALDLVIGGVEDRHLARGDDRPVALFEIGDAAGQRRQRQRVGAEKHLAVAVADRERAAAARADQQIVLAGEQKGEREGAFEPRQGLCHRLAAATDPGRGNAVARIATASVSVSVRKTWPSPSSSRRNAWKFSMMPLWTTATRSVAIGCALVSVGRPCVAQRVCPMPITPCTGSWSSRRGEIGELALGAAALDPAVDQGRDPGRIIAAVFEAAQPFEQPRRDRLPGDDADDAAHQFFLRSRARISGGAPRLVDLLAAGDRQRIGRDIPGDDAAGRDDRAVADRDRRHERRVRADKRAFADYRPVFVNAVIIAGDRAGADIGPRADLAVADIGEVIGLGPGAEPGRLDLDEIADMDVLLEDRSRAQPGKRADERARPDRRRLRDARTSGSEPPPRP